MKYIRNDESIAGLVAATPSAAACMPCGSVFIENHETMWRLRRRRRGGWRQKKRRQRSGGCGGGVAVYSAFIAGRQSKRK